MGGESVTTLPPWPQVGNGQHQRTDDSIYVIGTCFSLIKSLYSLNIYMWFYRHKIINFIYPFVFEQIYLGELLTENMIIHNNNKNILRLQSSRLD